MEKEFLENQEQLTKEGYVIISSYFLDYCVEILGSGPGMLYIQLLNYCHKGKDLAWPTLVTLGRKMQFTPKSITKFHQVLLKHGLIKKVIKGKTSSGNYNRNVYQVVPIHRVKNTLTTGNIFPKVEEKITPDLGKKLPTNNTNPNITNLTAANRENAAAELKKLKEKGDLSACNAQAEEKIHAPYNNKEHYKEQAVREQLMNLDFKESLVEKLLKGYSLKKIEEKLDLLLEKRNIQNPPAWLRSALKNDYRDVEQEDIPIQDSSIPEGTGSIHRARNKETGGLNPSPTKNINTPEQVSREEALEAIKLIQDNLSACMSPVLSGKRTRPRENVGVGFIRPVFTKY